MHRFAQAGHGESNLNTQHVAEPTCPHEGGQGGQQAPVPQHPAPWPVEPLYNVPTLYNGKDNDSNSPSQISEKQAQCLTGPW